MNLQFVLSIEVAAIAFGLAVFVLASNRKNLNHVIFALLSFSIAIWTVLNYLSTIVRGETALFWIKLVIFSAVPLQFLFWLFVHIFPRAKIKLKQSTFFLLILLAITTMAVTLSPYVFESVDTVNGGIVPNPGPLMPFFGGTILLFFIWGTISLFRKFFSAKGANRTQWRYILSGFLATFALLISFNFLSVVLFRETSFIAFGPVFILPFIILTTYAIVRKNLLDIRILSAELFTFFLIFIILTRLLLFQELIDLIIDSAFLAATIFFGALLIRSTRKEAENREKIAALASQLQSANKELKRLDRAKTEFLSIASHQLNTPLTAIKGYVSLLIEGSFGKIGEKAKTALKKVYISNERLIRLVNELLNLSRIERGKFAFRFTKAPLAEVVKSATDNARMQAREKKLRVKYTPPPKKLPLLSIDSDKLSEVFINIIDNAIKYTPSGEIRVSYELRKDEVIVKIEDTGVGMTEKDIKKVFQQFKRGEDIYKVAADGLGLGLNVAKKIVTAHKGRIWAKSEGKDKGSAFYVALPLKK